MFLRLLSDHAQQNITYHCRNSAAWYDEETGNYNKSIKLQGHNGVELYASSTKKYKPTVLKDDCRVSMKPIFGYNHLIIYTGTIKYSVVLVTGQVALLKPLGLKLRTGDQFVRHI